MWRGARHPSGGSKNLLVKNCEFGWIGGGIQGEGLFGRAWGVRYGNAVEVGGCDGYTVTNCYVPDLRRGCHASSRRRVALQRQGKILSRRASVMWGTCSRNAITRLSIFLSRCPEQPRRMEDFVIADNLMWDAGTGLWSSVRIVDRTPTSKVGSPPTVRWVHDPQQPLCGCTCN